MEENSFAFEVTLKKAIDIEGKPVDKLAFDFSALTGNDGLAIDRELSALRRDAMIKWLSTDYLVRLACRACDHPVTVDQLLGLPMAIFNKITAQAKNFLLSAE